MVSFVVFTLKVKISTYEFGDINAQSIAVTLSSSRTEIDQKGKVEVWARPREQQLQRHRG